jgi:hypothetical protein
MIHEFLKNEKNVKDDELLNMLNKTATCSRNELNKALMQLEILGLINVRWIGKDKRRIELIESVPTDETTPRQTS